MNIYKYPKEEVWSEIIARPRLDLTKLNETVSTVLADIRQRGDAAVREYELKFDKANLTDLAVTEAEMDEAEQLVSQELKEAIALAHQNIHTFHAQQRFEGQKVETQPGAILPKNQKKQRKPQKRMSSNFPEAATKLQLPALVM